MFSGKRILILAPHTDDGELGCGATIAKALREGADIWYVAFSKCEESLPVGAPKDTLVHELFDATSVLGINKNHVCIKNYKVRHFGEHRQEILDDLIKIDKKIDPNIIFVPSSHDIHQDHSTIAAESIRAFKKKTLLMYELPWNNLTFNNQAFSCVEENDVLKKIEALQQYKSQKTRQYTEPDNIKAVLKTHGIQIGKEYAEVFEVPRIIL